MLEYRTLSETEINRALFSHFIRTQKVTKCRRKENGKWVIRDDPFLDDWTEEDYQTLVNCLKNTVRTGGFVCGAFLDGNLKGFASVEPNLFGGDIGYMDLSSLHVSQDLRGQGIGSYLFRTAGSWAKSKGAKRLYISAHSAVETQAFYQKMGCLEAEVYNSVHTEAEPFDCQMECPL